MTEVVIPLGPLITAGSNAINELDADKLFELSLEAEGFIEDIAAMESHPILDEAIGLVSEALARYVEGWQVGSRGIRALDVPLLEEATALISEGTVFMNLATDSIKSIDPATCQ